MTPLNELAAELLETSASGYAAAALARWPETEPAAVPGTDRAAWKPHLVQRVLELAAAVRVEQPELFARRVTWLRRAALARGTDERDIERALRSLRAALQHELPANLKGVIAPPFDLALGAFTEPVLPEPVALDADAPLHRLALRYLAACLEGTPERAIDLVLTEIERGLAPGAAYADVLLPAQREVGHLWHVGDVSIAEEHLVSETTRDLMATIVANYAPGGTPRRTLIAASVAGNAHDLGLRAAADLFRLDGWRCLFLGANVPAAELARAADAFGADLVLLNATLDTHLKPLADAIATLRRSAPRCRILVGGRAFDGVPELAVKLGADAFAASIDAAVTTGNALVDARA
ncbi:MAG TPA: cobalamin-dependent protein [Gammaproteobacteria bacterium]|nr:cobalamin-dependent protein [Gammaproteobacteria bacterium]